MKDNTATQPVTGAARGGRRGLWLFPVVAVGLVLYLGFSFFQRWEDGKRLAAWTRERAVPNVSVVHPHPDAKPQIPPLPGNIAAWYEASIHAQVSGYVKSWRTDIGAVVKKGDVLAEIETPELDERLAQAREELGRAQAALDLAKVTASRWTALRNSSAVSKQSADEKTSDLAVKQADVGAAGANLDRLKAQKQFAQIVAPFDGIVKSLKCKVGDIVQEGAELAEVEPKRE